MIEQFLSYGLKHMLCTDISRDTSLAGYNVALYQEITQYYYPQVAFKASGASVASRISPNYVVVAGVDGVIVGRALLLEGKFSVEEAIACWQNG